MTWKGCEAWVCSIVNLYHWQAGQNENNGPHPRSEELRQFGRAFHRVQLARERFRKSDTDRGEIIRGAMR